MPKIIKEKMCESGVKVVDGGFGEVSIVPKFYIREGEFYRYIYLCRGGNIEGPFRPDSGELSRYSKYVNRLMVDLNMLYDVGIKIEIMRDLTASFIGVTTNMDLPILISVGADYELDGIDKIADRYIEGGDIEPMDKSVFEAMVLNGLVLTSLAPALASSFMTNKAVEYLISNNVLSRILSKIDIDVRKMDLLSNMFIKVINEMIYGRIVERDMVYRSMLTIACIGGVCIQAVPIIEDVGPYDLIVNVISDSYRFTFLLNSLRRAHQGLYGVYPSITDLIASLKNAFIVYAYTNNLTPNKLKQLYLALSIVERSGIIPEIVRRNAGRARVLPDSVLRRLSK